MRIGPGIRRLLGDRLSRRVGRRYRAIFVNLANEAKAIADAIPLDSHLLDVGGGDGEPLNYLLALRPDLRVTTLDPQPIVGQWIEKRYDTRVERLPGTSLAQYLVSSHPSPNVILIADVLHHIPEDARVQFLTSVAQVLKRVPDLRILVKDVEPGYWRSWLGYCSDRYITGDLHVNLISRERLERLMSEVMGPLRREDTNLFKTDWPNYAITFFR